MAPSRSRSITLTAVAVLLLATAGLVGWLLRPNAPPQFAGLDGRIEKLIASISESRLERLLTTLVVFGTRHTYSDLSQGRGTAAAAQWIFDELQRSSPRLQVTFDTHQIRKGGLEAWGATTRARLIRDVELRNVMAVLAGASPRRIYVTAHFDSLNSPRPADSTSAAEQKSQPQPDPNADAPGADDNASGTALVMELARVFAESDIAFDATLVFMASSGEEQGLVGARVHAARARDAKIPIQAVFNNDIVGGISGADGIVDRGSVRVYSEGPEDSPSRALAEFTRRVASRYVPSHRVRLLARRDRFGRSGDHSAFNLAGFAAVGFRESRENLQRQHNASDTVDRVSFPYLAQNARVNAAAVASLALAPPPPRLGTLSRQPAGSDARLRWEAAPDAARYRVVWREAWAPEWQHESYVGNVTEHVLRGVLIDDSVIGVAAVGPRGHESTVSAWVAGAFR